MSLVSFPRGLWWPQQQGVAGVFTNIVLNGTGIQNAFFGKVYIAGRASGKTISAAGGGSVGIVIAGSPTFANGGTTIDVGLQDMSLNSNPPSPTGVFDVKRTLTGGVDPLTSNTNMITLSTSGSKTINNGDVVAIVCNMTARAGADAVAIAGYSNGSMFMHYNTNQAILPSATRNNGAAWLTGQGITPAAIIVFDDGTLGMIEGGFFSTQSLESSFASGTNPNERGLVFQVPFSCKVDAFMVAASITGGTSDGVVNLYSTPFGTPVSMGSIPFTAAYGTEVIFGTGMIVMNFTSEITLQANTDYVIAFRATGAGSIAFDVNTLFSPTHKSILLPGGTNVKKVTRNGGAGAFTAEAVDVTLYSMGVRISALDTGGGTGGGGGSNLKMGISI